MTCWHGARYQMALPEINILITATADGVKRGVTVAANQLDRLESATDTLARNFQQLGDRLTNLGKKMSVISAGILGVGTAAFMLTKNVAEMADGIGDAAQAAGVSTDYFQEMKFALGQVADATEEEVAKGLSTMNRKLGEAAEGSKSAIAAFERIGISAADIQNGTVTTEQAMNALVQTLGDIKDPATAAAVAADVLGKSGASMGAMLAGSGSAVGEFRDRAKELGIVLGQDTLDAAGKFDGQMKVLTAGFEGLKVKLVSELLPVFVDKLLPVLIDTVIPALGSMAEKVGDLINWFTDLPAPIQEAVGVISTAFAVGGPLLVGIGLVFTALSKLVAPIGPIGLFIAAASLATAAWAAWGDDIKAGVGASINWLSEKFNGLLTILQSIIDKSVAVAEAIAKALGAGKQAEIYGNIGLTPEASGPNSTMSNTGMVAVGDNLAGGLVGGLGAGLANRQAEIDGYLNGITESAKTAYDTHSPSKVFEQIGIWIGEGLSNGISSTSGLVTGAVDAMAEGAKGVTTSMVGDILGSLGTLFKGSKAFALGQAVISMWQGAAEALKLPFPQNLVAFAKTAATGMTAVRNIQSAQPGSSSGGAGAASGAVGGAAAPAAQQSAGTYMNFQFTGGWASQEAMGRFMVDSINEAVKNGATIKGARYT